MSKLTYFILASSLFLSATGSGQFILDPYPADGSIVYDSTVVIKFRVAEAIDVRSLNESSLRVNGILSGRLNVQTSYSPEKQEVQLVIVDSLHRYDEIHVVITDLAQLKDGGRIPQGVEWSFYVDDPGHRDPDFRYMEGPEHVPEILPEPIGGIARIQQNVIYPVEAKIAGIQGMVFVMTYVDETGTVTKTEIIRGIGGGCDEAAADAIRKTRFSPGMIKGQPASIRMVIPIRFRITR